RIDFTKCCIEDFAKTTKITRLLLKLNNPLMTTRFAVIEVNGACCVIFDSRICFLASSSQCLVSIVDNNLFTKSINVLLGASRYLGAIGRERGKLDGVPNFITPSSGSRRDYQRIVLAQFHLIEGQGVGIFIVHAFDR